MIDKERDGLTIVQTKMKQRKRWMDRKMTEKDRH